MFSVDSLLSILPFALGALTGAVLVLLALLVRLELRLRRLLLGSDGKSVEKTLESVIRRTEELEIFQKKAASTLNDLDHRIHGAIRGTATVRFDAFRGDGSGGKQSFATAAISEGGDGFVLSSMHAREHTRVFAKLVRDFASENELTEEENRALQNARENTTK